MKGVYFNKFREPEISIYCSSDDNGDNHNNISVAGDSVAISHSALYIGQEAHLCTVSLTFIIMFFGLKEKPQQQN